MADLVIEHIYDRTNRGLDVNGKKFKAYTKQYVESIDGQIGGKTRNKVNLQLSGDMLATMTTLANKEGEIRIGWKNQTERAKAEGNILGSYGDDQAHPDKARPFFGIKPSKLREIIDSLE